MRDFGYRCRHCGETWFLPPASTIHCEWCAGPDPFGGDTCETRPTFDELVSRSRARPVVAAPYGEGEL